MSCGVGCRCASDPALLWLWRRLVATAPIQPLAWKPPYATGTAQKSKKNGGGEITGINYNQDYCRWSLRYNKCNHELLLFSIMKAVW